VLDELHNPGAPIDLRIGGLELTAFSISGVATYVLVPSFDACFDLGHCAMEATRLRNVFLTHVHQDHAGGAHRHVAIRRMVGARASRIFAPAESAEDLRDLLRAWDKLERSEEPIDVANVVKGVAAGDEIALGGRYLVKAFDVVHRIPSRGWTVVERRQKLKPEYEGRPGEEIGAARARGEVVSDTLESTVFTYVGDSTIETLRRHPEIFASGVLFLEATHLGVTGRDVSAKYGHTHLDELAELYRERPEIFGRARIVLKHFSTRYAKGEIKDAVARLPDELRSRITILVP
jgi:ribonuclease Z